ncbi:NAD(P)/FAD-dependent oxidoreductase [Pseudonocardia sp. NPDC049154]|uniref:flavin-containing monooxygenase n=1 Tax=Pseudonocardia sp. NPDC049154 TaxID=3155501 RepID=UPI0033E4BB5E
MGELRVVIVGAGMSGLYMAKMLADRGIGFTVLEKAGEVGGTWRDNRYPGLSVDIPAARYQLEFSPKYDFSAAFPSGPEIQDYLVGVTDEHDLRRHIRFGVEVVDCRWTGGEWLLTLSDGDELGADVVVAATGFLRVPTLPRLPGLDSFAGPAFHSSAWPEGLELAGKRIGIVGSGSSGIQLTAELGARGHAVTQFVRTPQWIETNLNPALAPDELDRARSGPEQGAEVLAALMGRIGQDPRLSDPYWKLAGAGDKRPLAQQALRDDVAAIRDPELRAALTPDFPPGCKRIPKSPTYYDVVQRENVRIVRAGVERVVPEGLVTPDGTVHELDVVVWATGFDTHAYTSPMTVHGRDGRTLHEVWAGRPYSYRGVSVPGFPNLFLLHGPFSPINNVPVPDTLRDETGYLCRLVEIAARDQVALEPTHEATEAFRARLAELIPQTVWGSGCTSWYQGADGLPVIWPWFEAEHRALFADLAEQDLLRVPLGVPVAAGEGA